MGIRKRGKRWLVTVELGLDERGARRRKCVSCETEGDAKRVEATVTADVLSGTYVEPSTATVAEFLDEWRSHAGRGRSQRTVDGYKLACEKHIKPALGRIRLAQLRALHIERFMTAQLEQKHLAPATVDKQFWILHKALDRAVAWGKLPRNPADQVEKPEAVESAARGFDVAEQALILGRAAGTWQYGPILLALATGMRRGEIVALRWKNVDLEAGIVAARSTRGGEIDTRFCPLSSNFLDPLLKSRGEPIRLQSVHGYFPVVFRVRPVILVDEIFRHYPD